MYTLYNKLKWAVSIVVLAAVTAACSDTTDYERPTLTLSAQNLSFGKLMDEQFIHVASNRSSWIASSSAEEEWLSLERKGDSLSVRVKNNETGLTRSSAIIIDAGLAVQKVMVSQSADDVILGVDGGEIIVPQAGGNVTAEVQANIPDYTITPEESAQWLKVIKKKHGLKVFAERNGTTQARTAAFLLRSGEHQSRIVVKQPGIEVFVLACNPGSPFNVHKVMDNEIRRGGFLTEYAAPDPSFDLTEESYFFKTPSPLFKDIVYVHDTQTGSATRIFTRSFSRAGIDAVRSQAFKDYAAQFGYVQSTADPNVFVSDAEKMMIKVDVLEENNSVVLFFEQIQVQEKDYPTFAKLDLGPLHLLHKTDKKTADVLAFEQGENSTLNSTYFFYTKGADASISDEWVGSVEQYTLNFSEPNLGVWQNGRNWNITKRFDALLRENGFEFIEDYGKYHVYGRRSDNLVLAIKGDKFVDINDNKPVLQIGVLYKPSVFSSSKSKVSVAVQQCIKSLQQH